MSPLVRSSFAWRAPEHLPAADRHASDSGGLIELRFWQLDSYDPWSDSDFEDSDDDADHEPTTREYDEETKVRLTMPWRSRDR